MNKQIKIDKILLLLFVVIPLLFISYIAISGHLSAKWNYEKLHCISTLDRIVYEIYRYKNDMGKFPDTLDQLQRKNGFNLKCPSTGKEYVYHKEGNEFELSCKWQDHSSQYSPINSEKLKSIGYPLLFKEVIGDENIVYISIYPKTFCLVVREKLVSNPKYIEKASELTDKMSGFKMNVQLRVFY